MKEVKIAGRDVSNQSGCFIIAEAGVNHNGSMEIARQLVDVAVAAGVDAVKFQTYKTEQLVTYNADRAEYQKNNTGTGNSQYEMLKKLELDYDNFRELKLYCDEQGIIFLSTPHTEDSAAFLAPLVPAFKLGSGDLTNIPFLEIIAGFGKPVILSTGMGTLEEVKRAVGAILKYNDQLILLHCTTQYPCPLDDVNLKVLETFKKEFDIPIGYSDHTEGIEVSLMAAQLGAALIEVHFTVDKNMEGPDHKASLSPAELKSLVEGIRSSKTINIPEKILGSSEKKPSERELKIMPLVRKSVISATDIPKGRTIENGMIIIKRPGTGIQPAELNRVIGRTAKRTIKADTPIQWDDLN